jgi:methylthioribose-1-phosphate isomerase
MIPTIEWHGNVVRMIDQRKIPAKTDWYVCRGYKDVIKAIKKMVIRGAPAIGVAAAMGLAPNQMLPLRGDSKQSLRRCPEPALLR